MTLRNGPLVYFGDNSLPHAKWDSAAAVLASPTSRGASYIDVSLPGRPAAQVANPATSDSSGGSSTAVASLNGFGSLQPSTSTAG